MFENLDIYFQLLFIFVVYFKCSQENRYKQ